MTTVQYGPLNNPHVSTAPEHKRRREADESEPNSFKQKCARSLVGQRFGRLTVTSEKSGKLWGRMCLCTCSCGNERWVRAVELRRKKTPTRSCSGRHPCDICGKSIGRQGEWSHLRLHPEVK